MIRRFLLRIRMTQISNRSSYFNSLFIGIALLSFGITILLMGVVYAQDVAVLRTAPEILWQVICGNPPKDKAYVMPVILVLSEIATLAGLGLLVLPRVKPPARMALLAVAAVGIAAAGYSIVTSAPSADDVSAARDNAIIILSPPQDVNPEARAIKLTNEDGQIVTLSDYKGRPTMIYFGYTFCPDICPTSMSEMARAKKILGNRGDEVSFMMISVDGERDTPEVMKRYVPNFDKNFIGLTAPSETVRPLAAKFGAQFRIDKPEGTQAAYLVSHTAMTYLLDANGAWRAAFPQNTAPERIAKEIANVLDGR